MNVYIECFYADGSQILGNLDGQAVIRTANYRRTSAYQRIKNIVGNVKHMDGRVASARVVTARGKVLETITTPN